MSRRKHTRIRWLIWGLAGRLPGVCPANSMSLIIRGYRKTPLVDSICRNDAGRNGDCYCGKLGPVRPGRLMTRRKAWQLAAVILAGLIAAVLAAGIFTAVHADAALVKSGPICQVLGWRPADTHRVILRNTVYPAGIHAGDRQCLTARGGDQPGYTVTRSTATNPAGKVKAFPVAYTGCLWTICTWGYSPMRVDRIGERVTTSYVTSHRHVDGVWNTAYDIWLSRNWGTTGMPRGAELMLWLNTHGIAPPAGAPVYRIDGVQWYLIHHRACGQPPNKRACWNYVQFRRVHPASSMRNIHLARYFRTAERLGLIRARWYVRDIGAGYEIWSGGRGLTTTHFDVKSLPGGQS